MEAQKLICGHCDNEITKNTKIDAFIEEVELWEDEELMQGTKKEVRVNVYFTCKNCEQQYCTYLAIEHFQEI